MTDADDAEKRASLKKRKIQHWFRAAHLPDAECDQQHNAEDEPGDGRRRSPPFDRCLDDRPHQGNESRRRQQRTERVETRFAGVRRVRDEEQRTDHADHGHRHVDQKHRSPPEVLEQPSTRSRPEDDTERGYRRPDPDRFGPLLRITEDMGENRQRRGHDERAADPHHRARSDQFARRAGPGRPDRREAEHQETGDQSGSAPESVTEASGCQNQAGEDQRVAVDHPLQLARTGVEIVAQ